MVSWSRLFRAIIDFTVALVESVPVRLGEEEAGVAREQGHRRSTSPGGQEPVQAGGRSGPHSVGVGERGPGGGGSSEAGKVQRSAGTGKKMRLELPKRGEGVERVGKGECPICEVMSPLCDGFEDAEKRLRCWELVYKVAAGIISPEEFADQMLALDPERVRRWLEGGLGAGKAGGAGERAGGSSG